ncbi:ribonuclease [Clostridium acidisoli DSM 12555]|uniref:Ribonuclease n=1 Tax=Clostridium acidisoli DSM 12555 TaxID=1121291 RepID=A0A1W1X7U4_9CLOT|nr:ribonuclease [Clostridium acidisoli]SMC20035.1 ribonuclease [Clostridium acidisoli DSM 12555]
MKKIKTKFSLLIMSLFFLVATAINFLPMHTNAFTMASTKNTASTVTIINDFQGVANYIHEYNKLPSNYITKEQAEELGWEPGFNLWDYAPGCSIGGDIFTNSEGVLPSAPGRVWHECDINYNGGHRGADRLVYSNDGLIYGTSDHYNTFTQYY